MAIARAGSNDLHMSNFTGSKNADIYCFIDSRMCISYLHICGQVTIKFKDKICQKSQLIASISYSVAKENV